MKTIRWNYKGERYVSSVIELPCRPRRATRRHHVGVLLGERIRDASEEARIGLALASRTHEDFAGLDGLRLRVDVPAVAALHAHGGACRRRSWSASSPHRAILTSTFATRRFSKRGRAVSRPTPVRSEGLERKIMTVEEAKEEVLRIAKAVLSDVAEPGYLKQNTVDRLAQELAEKTSP